MNVVDLNFRLRELQIENERLRNTLNSQRNSQFHRGNAIDFESKYKKALKQIYEVIQANKQLKEELDKLKTSRSKVDGSMADVRKEEIYKVYESVLREKNQLKEKSQSLQSERERYQAQLQALEAEVNILKGEKMYLAQQKQAAEARSLQQQEPGSKGEELQQLQIRMREKEQEFHRTLENYEQHHMTLSNQNKKNEERLNEMEQRLIENDKNWRNRLQAKEIEFKEIRTNVRHEYQDQINSLRKELNNYKLLNTELSTRLQTIELEGRNEDQMSEYEMQMLNSIKELRLQMEPLKKQIIELQEQNSFEKQQAERQRTQLQLKLYEYESNIQHYTGLIKNQEQKLNRLNEQIKKHHDNQSVIKKLEEENKILGGRVIVLESKDLAIEGRRESGARKLEENILEFQTRVEMLLNEKQNLVNVKNVGIHQLVTLKAYIVEMDQKLKSAHHQNEYATKKYKSYKDKYLTAIKEIKNHQVLQNTLKSKILGYDKLVQRLQSELEKNVNISEMQVIEMNTKTTHEQVQIQTFKKKYQSLKEKLLLQEKYNKQELETVKLNYETKIVDLTIKAEETNSLRQSIALYKQKNQDLMQQLAQKENQILEVRLSVGKQANIRNDNELTYQNQNRELISSLQQTIHKQQATISKIQAEARTAQENNRKRIMGLERELNEINTEYNKVKLSSSTRYTAEKSSEELSSQNKRLKNRISELESQLILTRGRNSQEPAKNTYELEFRISNLEIERNQLANRLETQISYKKRLEKQCNQTLARNNELDAEVTQLNLQMNRKLQEAKYELGQKQSQIQNMEQEIKRLKAQQRSNLQSSTLMNSAVVVREDTTMLQNKIRRLQRDLQNLQNENENLRKRVNETAYSSNSFNFELQSLKHEKEEARLKIQRLEKELSSTKNSIQAIEDEKYELNRTVTSLKSQLSSTKLNHQDEMFEKDRVIAQLKSQVEHSESLYQNLTLSQNQLEQSLQDKERQLLALRSRVQAAQSEIDQLNDTINRYNNQIASMKYANESSHSAYNQQMEQLLEEKSRTLRKYEQQINELHSEIEIRNQEISLKTEALTRLQRQLSDFKQVEQEIERLKSSLLDRQTLISRNRFEISSYEEQNQTAKKEISALKEQLQRLRLESLQKDDDISSLRLELSTLGNRVTNQVKNELMEQLSERQSQISRLTFQIQSLQNSYNNLQEELNEVEGRERRAQQELMFAKNQLVRAEEQLSQASEKLMRKQSQLSQINGQVSGLRLLEEEVNEKNMTITKLRGQITTIRIQVNHLKEQIEYKQSTILRQNNEIKMVRQQLMEREEMASKNDMDLRNVMLEVNRLKATLEDNEISLQQKDNTITKLTADLNKVKQEHREMEEEIEEREQEWANIQYELNQAKNQLVLIADQLQGKDLTIAKLSNEAAFLKQEITRLNEQLVEKNHEINRVSQQVFVQKMQYTNRTSEQVQTLSNQLFGVKRQLESTRHTVEDLEAENRRLKIQLQGSRVKFNQQNSLYLYTEQDLSQLKEENNKKYRQIMQLQFDLNQQASQYQIVQQRLQHAQSQVSAKNDQIELLSQKSQKLQQLLSQQEQENHFNSQHIQAQIQQFIETERRLRYQIEQLQNSQSQQPSNTLTQNQQELKFGLKLYTQETDRLKLIIQELNEEVSGLKLKLAAFTNQQDRLQENLITMVLSFAEIEALRDRMKNKEIQINEVRRSFIQAISSSSDVQSQGFKSSKLVKMANNAREEKIQTFEDVMSQDSASLLNYQIQKEGNQGQEVREIQDYEIKSQTNPNNPFSHQANLTNQQQAQTHSLDQEQRQLNNDAYYTHEQSSENLDKFQRQAANQGQQAIELPEPESREEEINVHNTSQTLQELNKLRESREQDNAAVNQAVERNQQNVITPQESVTVVTQNQITNIITSSQQQQLVQSQQRGRQVNIVYQGSLSQVQTASSLDRIQAQQRISSSQFQAPSGATYVRITSNKQQPRMSLPQTVQTRPGMYVPQGMSIAPVRQPIQVSQSMPQQGNRIIVPNQMMQGQLQGQQITPGAYMQQGSQQNMRF